MEIVKSYTDGISTIALSGRFTFFDHGAFRDVLDEIGLEHVHKLVLDMAKLLFIDSAGLGQLLLLHDEAAKHSKTLILKGAIGQVRKVFEIAHFEAMFTLQE